MKKTILALAASVAIVAPAFAQAPAQQTATNQQTTEAPELMDNQFKFEGAVWTIVKGFDGHPVKSTNFMTPGFGNACTRHRIDIVKVSREKCKMSAADKFRGDGCSHVVCNRDGWQQRVAQ